MQRKTFIEKLNMTNFLIFAFFSFSLIFQSTHALERTGDGSDGDCLLEGEIESREYQCRSLEILPAGIVAIGENSLIFRIQGPAIIGGPIVLAGARGNNGSATSSDFPLLGGAPGPGGFSGANCPNVDCDQQSAPNNTHGGAGKGGSLGSDPFFSGGAGGGGGSGGSHSLLSSSGENGSSFGVGTAPGVGGLPPNSTYGALQLATSEFKGGSGGGAGGGGTRAGSNSSGGTGGGGGGALAIFAKESVAFTSLAKIDSSGGPGGDGFVSTTTGPGGGAGGGAGGTIFIVSENGQIQGTGQLSLQANGGPGGNGAKVEIGGTVISGGNGSTGSPGRIFLADCDGAVNLQTTPLPEKQKSGECFFGNIQQKLESSISCGSLAYTQKQTTNLRARSFLLLFFAFILLLLLLLIKRTVVGRDLRRPPSLQLPPNQVVQRGPAPNILLSRLL